MAESLKLGHPRKNRAVAVLTLSLLFSAQLLAQKTEADNAKPPKYDLQSETKVKGVVQEVKLPLKGSGEAHLMVKSGDTIFDAYLCPVSFLDEMEIKFNKGDEVSLTGSKVKQNDTDVVLARELARGTDTLVLRDDKGNPVWGPRR